MVLQLWLLRSSQSTKAASQLTSVSVNVTSQQTSSAAPGVTAAATIRLSSPVSTISRASVSSAAGGKLIF